MQCSCLNGNVPSQKKKNRGMCSAHVSLVFTCLEEHESLIIHFILWRSLLLIFLLLIGEHVQKYNQTEAQLN
jgi:hypothetical protein